MLPVFFSSDYVGSHHAFDTTRKAKWIADSLAARPISGVQLHAPKPLVLDDVIKVHDPAYVLAVLKGEPSSLAESQGFPWDANLLPMVLASNGGFVGAALAAIKSGCAGSLSSGLHHARHNRGAGFCTFNGLALAAQTALAAGADSVLIVDLDAHCGGGTHSLIRNDSRIWQLDVSVCPFDYYKATERSYLTLVDEAEDYLPTIIRALDDLEKQAPRFDLCLYNAGMDPFECCDVGGLEGISRDILEERERLVFSWCKVRDIPIAFALAGGYVGSRLDETGLVDLHRITLSAAAAM